MRLHVITKTTLLSAAFMGVVLAGFVILFPLRDADSSPSLPTEAVEEIPEYAMLEDTEEGGFEELAMHADVPVSGTFLMPPIEDAERRVTKKPFGIEIHPETSPVAHDRFDGFHVGVDFEAFPEEAEIDVPIFAICDGPLRFKNMARGYGGVAVQACRIDGEDVSVIYGHLRLASVTANPGEPLRAGARLGVLGTGGSEETDGVRKHLHLGIRRGLTNDIRGYVPEEDDIAEWLDVIELLGLDLPETI